MLLQGKDGELRLLDRGGITGAEPGSTTYYLSLLFCEMDFTGPLSRPRTDETLMMNRGTFSTDAHYIEGNDEPRYAPIPITFSCRLNDTVNTQIMVDWLSGVSQISNAASGSTLLYSWEGGSTIDGNTLKAFEDDPKMSYRVEVLWDGENDICMRYEEVYFKPGEQSITESADGLMLSGSGMCYGDVTRISAFQSGTSVLSFI